MTGAECHCKVEYKTKGDAMRATQTFDMVKPLRAYKCPHCGFFHLTSNPPGKPRKDRNARTH